MVRFFKNLVYVTIPTLIIVSLLLEVFFRVVIPATDLPHWYFDEEERITKHCPNGGEGTATFGKFAQHQARWRINNHGWNSPIDYVENKDKPRIAVIGDSFIEAWQVDTDKSCSSLLRAALRHKYDVYSFGRSGAALSEYLNISRYVNRHFDPNIVIFNVVHNDFRDSVYELNRYHKSMLMVSFSDGTITETTPEPDYSNIQYNTIKRLIRKSAFVRYLVYNLKLKRILRNLLIKKEHRANIDVDETTRHKDLIQQATEYIIERIHEENRGKRIIFVMNGPNEAIYDGTVEQRKVFFLNEMLRNVCSEYGLEFLDLTLPMLRDYKTNGIKFILEGDGHWNEYGHRFVCSQILSLGFPGAGFPHVPIPP